MSNTRRRSSSADHSDSDDWTLLSPPKSSSSSSTPSSEEMISEPKLESIHSSSSSCSSLEQTGEGLLEIDLNTDNDKTIESSSKLVRSSEATIIDKTQMSSISDHVSEDEHDQRHSSSGQERLINANEYYTLRKRPLMHKVENAKLELVAAVQPQAISTLLSSSSATSSTKRDDTREIESTNNKVALAKTCASRSSNVTNNQISDPLLSIFAASLALIVTLIVFFICLIALIPIEYVSEPSSPEKVCYKYVGTIDRLEDEDGILPKHHHFEELRSLHTDLNNCIRRQNPTSFTYYMSPVRSGGLKGTKPPPDVKPFKGLVCYEQETKWRKRIKRLKTEYGIDLISLTQEIKRRVTNEIVQIRDSGTSSDKVDQLDLNLILNQIEYLDYVDKERNKRRLEESLKHITVENMYLVRRIKRPTTDNGNQRSFASVELENIQLQRENAKLKANLMEKVGPIYMKQALELEVQERENLALRKFYHQVAKEVSRGLKQFNLHTIETADILGDDENLNAQLMLTRGYLRRLSEKISSILIENGSLKEELNEIYSSNAHNKANLPATQNAGSSSKTRTRNGTTNVSVSDGCMRSLMELQEKTARLEDELEETKRNCSSKSVNLEKSGQRYLNKLNTDTDLIEESSSFERSRLGLSDGSVLGETELDKHASDLSASIKTEEMVDKFISFLTEFNEQIESERGLTRVQAQTDKVTEQYTLEGFQVDNNQPKVIPNYIREAIRSARNGLGKAAATTTTTTTTGASASIGRLPTSPTQYDNTIELPPIPPPIYTPTASKINMSRCYYPDISLDKSSITNYHETKHNKKTLEANETDSNEVGSTYERPNEILPDTWFFKRAKQRRNLRRDGSKLHDHFQSDWLTKRAKLREKLRKASTYIETYYKPREDYDFSNISKEHSRRFKPNPNIIQQDSKGGKYHQVYQKKQHKQSSSSKQNIRANRKKFIRDEL